MPREIYHSSTLGPIHLSFNGRRLMQNLREAVQEMLEAQLKCERLNHVPGSSLWEPVSLARGRIAKYISELESRAGSPFNEEPYDGHFGTASNIEYLNKHITAITEENKKLMAENGHLRKKLQSISDTLRSS